MTPTRLLLAVFLLVSVASALSYAATSWRKSPTDRSGGPQNRSAPTKLPG